VFFKDLLIVDRELTPLNGDIIVCNYNGNFTCKILDKTNRQLGSAYANNKPVVLLTNNGGCTLI
jgi:DNA polymerase V